MPFTSILSLQIMESVLSPGELAECLDTTAFPESVVYELFSRIVNGPITIVIAGIGIVGNVHSMQVVRHFRISKVSLVCKV